MEIRVRSGADAWVETGCCHLGTAAVEHGAGGPDVAAAQERNVMVRALMWTRRPADSAARSARIVAHRCPGTIDAESVAETESTVRLFKQAVQIGFYCVGQ